MAVADTSTTMIQLGETQQQRSLSEIIALGLPVICVETVDHEEPTCEVVTAPPGSWGSTINAEKVPGRLVIYNRIAGVDSIVYDSGEYEKDVSGMTIRIRGNTSARGKKKPYKIKFQKKFDMLFRGVDSVYKDKEWLLLVDDNLFTSRSFFISKMVGTYWVPGHQYVNVILNGSYRGFYLLTEAVKRNPDCRLNVDKNSGYIFEHDVYWWNEPIYVYSCDHPSYNYIFKYPDKDDVTEENVAYLQDLVNRFEASQSADNYPDLIDVTSFANWTLVHDIVGTKDGGGANRFYVKYDTTAESKITMPVVWDFDMAERSSSEWSRCHTRYMGKLFNNPNRTFVNEFVRRWCLIRDTYLEAINNEHIRFTNSPEGFALQASYHLDNIVWDRDLWFQNQALNRKNWVTKRFTWLDPSILSLRTINDVNLDGVVNITDVTSLISMLLGTQQQLVTGDINGDEDINIADVTELINILLTTV